MRKTTANIVIALAAIVAAGSAPVGAASAYHMDGQGSLTLSGGGLPACLGGQGDCASVDIPFSWGELTVQGAGLLQDQNVAGQYECRSEGTVGGSAFQSRIRGNATSFELTFNFQCTSQAGVGPAFINGWFSNVTGTASGAYQSVETHPHPSPVAPGAPVFKGFFAASNLHPYSIDASNGDAMTCGGGFVPTAMNGLRIQTAVFLGACQALEA